MGQELDQQDIRVERVDRKTGTLDNRVYLNTQKVCSHTMLCFSVLHNFLPAAQEDQVIRWSRVSMSPALLIKFWERLVPPFLSFHCAIPVDKQINCYTF